jgi:hypothetical protein
MRANLRAALGSPPLILALLFLLLLAASAAFAVTITLSSGNVNAIGGTGLVAVNCPASPCSVTSVTWTLQGVAPFYIQSATVAWTPSFTGSAQVCVNIYTGASTTPTAGACATASGLTSGTATTTTVTFSTAVNPQVVDKVEVIIAQG